MLADPIPTPIAAPARRLQVLVADDEPMIVRAINVSSSDGATWCTPPPTPTARSTSSRRTASTPCLVDDRMPGGGRSVLGRLEERQYTGTAVLMTGGAIGDDDVQGAVQWLQKPFPFPAIVALVEGGEV